MKRLPFDGWRSPPPRGSNSGGGLAGSRRRGFTLIELLVVISIITILATLTVSAAFKVRETSRIRTARTSAMRLAQAIESYQVLKGFLPLQLVYNAETDADAAYENYDIVQQLNGVMNRDPLLKTAASELNGLGSFKDPWSRPYRVVMWKETGESLNKYFRVYSCGPNMKWEHGVNNPKKPGKPDDIAPKH